MGLRSKQKAEGFCCLLLEPERHWGKTEKNHLPQFKRISAEICLEPLLRNIITYFTPLSIKGSSSYLSVCVCLCVCMCVHVSVRVCVHVCVHVRL